LVEEPVSDIEVCDDNEEVENLTADKTSQVDSILVADPLLKIFDKPIFSLIHIVNISTPSSFSKIFHQTTLKMQPEHPWNIKEDSRHKEVEWYPLVVGVVDGQPGNILGVPRVTLTFVLTGNLIC